MSEQPKEPRKMCELHAIGEMAEIDRQSDRPQFVCGKCRRKANRSQDLHNPLPLKKSAGDTFWG